MRDVLVDGKDLATSTRERNSAARAFNKLAKQNNRPEKIPTTLDTVMKGYMVRYKELNSWGFDDYVTHAMRGSVAVVDEKGRVITVGETSEQAAQRAGEYLRSHPYVNELFIDTSFWFDQEIPLLVSRKQYGYLVARLSKGLKDEAGKIDKAIQAHIAKGALGRAIAIKPREVYSQFLQESRDILPGEENVFEILSAYVHSLEKKMAFDSYIKYFARNIDKLNSTPVLKEMLEDQLDAARGKYWDGDKRVDNLLRGLGIQTKGYGYSRAIRMATSVEANLKFAYRFGATSINLLSGMGHTWTKTGAGYMLQANKLRRTEEGKALLDKHAPDLGTPLAQETGGKLRSATPLWHPTGLFQMPEYPNRTISFLATYLMSKDLNPGLSEDAHMQVARNGLRVQQFNYNIASVPKMMRSPTGKLLFQFKTYLVKELEFMYQLEGAGEWAKYLTMQALLGGPRGMLLTIKSFPLIALAMGAAQVVRGGGEGPDWLDQFEQYCNAKIPRLYRGAFGFFGIDASMPASFQFPSSIGELVGVFGSDLVKFYKNIVVPISQSVPHPELGALTAAKQTIPIFRTWYNIVESQWHDGWIWNERGQKSYKVDGLADLVKLGAGVTPLGKSIRDTSDRILQDEIKKKDAQAKNAVLNAVMNRRRFGVDKVAETIARDCVQLVISPETILNAIMQAEIDPSVRTVLRSKVRDKLKAEENRREINQTLHGMGVDPSTIY